MRSTFALFVSIACATGAFAHGQVKGVSADGQWVQGPNVYYDGDAANANTVVRKMYPASSPAYLLPQDFSNGWKMACEEAAPAPKTLKVKAGSVVQVEWEGATSELKGTGNLWDYNPWVHAIGPVIDYIAECQGPCNQFWSADQVGFSKLAEFGLDGSQSISDSLRSTMQNKPEPYRPDGNGVWGQAQLLGYGSKWDIHVPSELKNGEYLLRHELASLHNPRSDGDNTSGPQHYVACIQIEVTDGGSASLPEGTKAGDLYDPNGSYSWYNVISDPWSFSMPGPATWNPSSNSKREVEERAPFNNTASRMKRHHRRASHDLN